ncbi:MAG: nitroreductase family protein [bacterium]
MKIIEVNLNKCTKCKLCLNACPANLFSFQNDCINFQDPNHWCIKCGHCLAICPAQAVEYDLSPSYREYSKNIPHQLLSLLNQRSIRNYSEEQVSPEKIEFILEAMRYSASGHNLQGCKYIVIKDRKVQLALSDFTIKAMKKFLVLIKLRYFIKLFIPSILFELLNDPSTSVGIKSMISDYEKGKDVIFFNAPLVILIYYPEMGEMSLIDPIIAATNGIHAAHLLGLGSCWMGFVMQAIAKSKKIKNYLSIPKDHRICAVFTLGYPQLNYSRIPPRKKIKVNYI